MGLLDNIENMALSKVAGANPEIAGILQIIQNYPGGITGLIQAFHSNGLGGIISSWTGNGQNQSISPSQVEQVLGSEKVQEYARKVGLSPEAASSKLAQWLPDVMDKLTPGGAIPDQSNVLQMGENILSSFGKTGTNG